MKKTIFFISLLLFLSVFIFAFSPHRPEAVDVRSMGFGNTHFTDKDGFYTLFSNPAVLGLVQKKTIMWPPIISMGLGGPLDVIVPKIASLTKGDLSAISDVIGDNGINFGARLGSPLTFGVIKEKFGWGVFNTIYLDANVPSISKSDISVGGDLAGVVGFAYPFDFGNFGVLSLGASARAIVQFEGKYNKGIVNLLGNKIDFKKELAMYMTFGFGLDLGVQYKIFDSLHFAVVWQDVYTPLWIKQLQSTTSKLTYTPLESRLGFGVGYDIPIQKITRGVVSRWSLYLDYKDVWPVFRKNGLYRNPVLEIAGGTEVELFKIVSLRLGITEMYPALGIGLQFGKFQMNFAAYGRELGLEPGFSPQFNMGLSMAFTY